LAARKRFAVNISALDIESFVSVAIAAGLGALLGVEREIAGKPAGIRTHMFVCTGSALMMILGQSIITHYQQAVPMAMISADPIRILQAIVLGISFLGAGTIVYDKSEGVEGLTTAATIYLTAGIGVAAAVDRVWLALAVTLLAVSTLVIVGRIERWARHHNLGRKKSKSTANQDSANQSNPEYKRAP